MLHAHDVVCMPRILILLKIGVDIWELDRRRIGEGRLGDLGREIIKELGQERESGPNGILLVGNDDS